MCFSVMVKKLVFELEVCKGLNGVRVSFIHIGACVCVCVCVCLDKRLIDCGDLKTKVRVSFIVLATLW